MVNGFSFQKYGISTEFDARPNVIRNNYFYNCGIDLAGAIGDTQIINNQITGGTISLGDTARILIKGTTVSKSKRGLWMGNEARDPTVTGCTFKYCEYAVYFTGYGEESGNLNTFYGNKYIGNKHNFGWN